MEKSLNEHKSFREIARYLCKDPSTISKEVWKHRIDNTWNRGSFNNPYNFCIHRYRCSKPRHMCTIQTKYDYNAKATHRHYEELLVSSRARVNLSKKNFNSSMKPLPRL
ncbi:MAG: helix-turn-helix domain-containing protein [Lachnospiraceae bacterium]|nr:helix-turn-helix domain-containing protein [Lachnospiraceae bacterium]